MQVDVLELLPLASLIMSNRATDPPRAILVLGTWSWFVCVRVCLYVCAMCPNVCIGHLAELFPEDGVHTLLY